MWETQRIDLKGGEAGSSGLNIRAPWSKNQYCTLDFPRFVGRTANESFQVDPVLRWSEDEGNAGRVHFAMEGNPAEAGVDFHGDVTLAEPDEIHVSLSLTNCTDTDLKSGRTLIFLDIGHMPELVDPQGVNTHFYTDAGWRTRAELLKDAGITDPTHAIRVGSNLGRTTVIWDLVARMDQRRERMLAFSLNRAFAFSCDHPDWGAGVQAACRWSNLASGERHYALGVIYLLPANLQDLEDRYIKNRKRR